MAQAAANAIVIALVLLILLGVALNAWRGVRRRMRVERRFFMFKHGWIVLLCCVVALAALYDTVMSHL